MDLKESLQVCQSNLQNWEEGLEGDASLGLLVLHQAPDVGLSRVLAEGAKYFADLVCLENDMNFLKRKTQFL